MSPGDPHGADFAALGALAKAHQRAAAERLAAGVSVMPTIRPRLVAMLADPDPQRRWGAAYALGISAMPGPEPVGVLVEILGSRDGDLRWAATRVLAAMAPREPSVVPALREALGAASPLRRKMALYGLRDIGAGGIAVLRPHLGDPDPAVRLAAVAAVATRPAGEDVAMALQPLLDDPDAGVRRAVAATLGRVGALPAAVVETLERLAAQIDDPALARAARSALSSRAGTARR
jgi:HEAT repeat protein